MTIGRRVAANSSIQIVGKAVKVVSTLAITALLARYLGVEGFGKYSFILSYVALFAIISDFGLSTISVREMSRDKSGAGPILGNLILLRGLLALAVFVLVALTSGFFDTLAGATSALYWAMLLPILEALYSIELIFQVYLRMGYSVLARAVTDILAVVLVIMIILQEGSPSNLIAVTPISLAVGLLILAFYARRFVKIKFSVNLTLWRKLIKAAVPFGVAVVMYTILWRADTLILAVVQGDGAVGIYQIARRFIDISAALSGVIIVSLFPVFSAIYMSDHKKTEAVFQKAFVYVTTISFLIAIFFILTAEDLVTIIAGGGFEDSALTLQILSLSIPPYFITALASAALIAANRQVIPMGYAILGTAVNVVLNLLLVGQYSYFGVAWATVVAFTIQAIAAIYFSARVIDMHILWKNFLQVCLITVLIAVLGIGAVLIGLNSIVVTLAACTGYALMLLWLKVISIDELMTMFRGSNA